MKTYCFKLYDSKRNRKLHSQINAAGLVYNHCIALLCISDTIDCSGNL